MWSPFLFPKNFFVPDLNAQWIEPNLLRFNWDKEKHFSQADFEFQGFYEKNANAELWIRSENSAHLEAVPEIFK